MFSDLNGKKKIIGLIHLLPMPGTPFYKEGNIQKMTDKALKDAEALQRGGATGGLLQAIDSLVFPCGDECDYSRVATLAMIGSKVRDMVGPEFKLGVQIMFNCITPSLAVAKAIGADFTRCSALIGTTESIYGPVIANPLKVMEYREKIKAEGVEMVAEISGYHFTTPGSIEEIQEMASSAMRVGAQCVEVYHPNFEENENLVKAVKKVGRIKVPSREKGCVINSALEIPVMLGGGTDVANCKERLKYADGAFVGAAFEDFEWGGSVKESCVKSYMEKVKELENERL